MNHVKRERRDCLAEAGGEPENTKPDAALQKLKGDITMSKIEMDAKIKELRELKRMAAELADEITSIEDAIKAEMTARETDTLTGLDWKVTWKASVS